MRRMVSRSSQAHDAIETDTEGYGTLPAAVRDHMVEIMRFDNLQRPRNH